jgi:hypothetical protein
VFPHIRRGSSGYYLQIDIKEFPVHHAHIQWDNKDYDFFFKNLGAGRVTLSMLRTEDIQIRGVMKNNASLFKRREPKI